MRTTTTGRQPARNGVSLPSVKLVATLSREQAVEELRKQARSMEAELEGHAKRERRAQAIVDYQAGEQRRLQQRIDDIHALLFERFGVAP